MGELEYFRRDVEDYTNPMNENSIPNHIDILEI